MFSNRLSKEKSGPAREEKGKLKRNGMPREKKKKGFKQREEEGGSKQREKKRGPKQPEKKKGSKPGEKKRGSKQKEKKIGSKQRKKKKGFKPRKRKRESKRSSIFNESYKPMSISNSLESPPEEKCHIFLVTMSGDRSYSSTKMETTSTTTSSGLKGWRNCTKLTRKVALYDWLVSSPLRPLSCVLLHLPT